MAVQAEDKMERGNILQSAEVQQRVGSEKVGQETVQKGQVKEGVKKVVEFVLGELNMQQLFFMPHRIARSIYEEEELVFKIMGLVLTMTMKTEKSARETAKFHP
jgi:hypothetical protein